MALECYADNLHSIIHHLCSGFITSKQILSRLLSDRELCGLLSLRLCVLVSYACYLSCHIFSKVHLLCRCKALYFDAVKTNCGHVFCRSCIEPSPACLKCGASVETLTSDTFIQGIASTQSCLLCNLEGERSLGASLRCYGFCDQTDQFGFPQTRQLFPYHAWRACPQHLISLAHKEIARPTRLMLMWSQRPGLFNFNSGNPREFQ